MAAPAARGDRSHVPSNAADLSLNFQLKIQRTGRTNYAAVTSYIVCMQTMQSSTLTQRIQDTGEQHDWNSLEGNTLGQPVAFCTRKINLIHSQPKSH